MKEKDKYLVSVDLDATFLNSESQISSTSKRFVRKFVKQGNHFLINTGRPHQSAVNFLKNLGIHEPVISSNGSSIVYYNKDYTQIEKAITFSIPCELVKKFIKETKSFLNGMCVNTLYNVYSFDFNKVPFWVVHTSSLVSKVEGDIEKNLQNDVLSIEAYVKDEYHKEFKNIFQKEEYQTAFSCIEWGCWDNVHSYEIHAHNASKGKALLYMEKEFGISHENTFGFGDQLNDLPLLESAFYGVSMLNAREEVKSKTKYQTKKDNDHDGVIDFVKEIINLK